MAVNKLTVRKCYSSLLISSLCAFAMPVFANYQMDFSGFASIVANKTLTSKNSNQGNNYDMLSSGSNTRDLSLLGLRLDVDFDNKLSFTTQAVMHGNDDFKPKFDWIFASYNISNTWQISVGRTRTPLFMYSAYQDVSYAYTWLAPPYSVYGIPRFKSVDGIKMRHYGLLGEWSSDLQFWYGSIEENLKTNDIDGDLVIRDNIGVAWDLERYWLRLHSVYMTGKTSLDLMGQDQIGPLLSAIKSVDPKLAKKLEWQSVRAHFAGLGIAAEFDRFFVNAEATYIYMGDNIATARSFQSYYLTLGTRVADNWTLAATFTRDRDREHARLKQAYGAAEQNSLPLSSYEFEQQLNQLQQYDTQGIILGIRWDFHRSASTKLEYLAEERVYGKDNSNKYRPQAIRLGVDIVF